MATLGLESCFCGEELTIGKAMVRLSKLSEVEARQSGVSFGGGAYKGAGRGIVFCVGNGTRFHLGNSFMEVAARVARNLAFSLRLATRDTGGLPARERLHLACATRRDDGQVARQDLAVVRPARRVLQALGRDALGGRKLSRPLPLAQILHLPQLPARAHRV